MHFLLFMKKGRVEVKRDHLKYHALYRTIKQMNEKQWTQKCEKALVGKTVVAVRYLTAEEAKECPLSCGDCIVSVYRTHTRIK